MSNYFKSLIRTYVPIIVGGVASYLTTKGLELDAETQAGLIIALTGFLQALYYFVARTIEQRFPGTGSLLLGSKSVPVYKKVKE